MVGFYVFPQLPLQFLRLHANKENHLKDVSRSNRNEVGDNLYGLNSFLGHYNASFSYLDKCYYLEYLAPCYYAEINVTRY